MQPPPCSTLFPYTTLFRSCRALFASWYQPTTVQLPTEGHDTDSACELDMPRPGTSIACCQVPKRSTATVARDRKSTRLNSSHPSISYAVFCLKKKKHTI